MTQTLGNLEHISTSLYLCRDCAFWDKQGSLDCQKEKITNCSWDGCKLCT